MARHSMAPQHILITGASSGLGAALAVSYATPGTTLSLTGRNEARLNAVAKQCQERGAQVCVACIDITNKDAVNSWIDSRHGASPLDIVIANAGISGGSEACARTAEIQTRRLFDVNVNGVFNTVFPALQRMEGRGGNIAIISSLAGWRGFAGAPAYCASKAAVKVWGEALHGLYKPKNIAVSVVCPGFVKTPMTAVNPYKMPFLMRADTAAKIIQRGIKHGKPRIAFPLPMVGLLWLTSLFPERLAQCITRRFPEKPPLDQA